jgi:CheY-like chemotaxis protein
LAISRWVTEAHGGSLNATSEGKDKGATFRFEVDTVASPAEAEGTAPVAGAPVLDLPPLRILLAEDNADTLVAMARLLRMRGFEVSTATTLGSAVELATSQEFDLIVSDINLPDGSGLDLMRRARAQSDVKGIALSGFGMEDDIRRSHEAGFSVHLTKPVDARALDETIVRVARGQEAQSLAS